MLTYDPSSKRPRAAQASLPLSGSDETVQPFRIYQSRLAGKFDVSLRFQLTLRLDPMRLPVVTIAAAKFS